MHNGYLFKLVDTTVTHKQQ